MKPLRVGSLHSLHRKARPGRLAFGSPSAAGVTVCPPSLDFLGRTTVLLTEIARKLGCTVRHLNNEVDSGALTVLDLRGPDSVRRCPRVPIECYRDYICRRLSGPVAPPPPP